jgi:sortase A
VTPVVYSRILGGLGRTMISAGVLLLLFVVYQLWGTGVRTAGAQTTLRGSFEDHKAALAANPPATEPATTVTTAPPSTTAPPRGATTTATTATTTPAPPSTAPPMAAPRKGDAVGVIRIPKIDVDFTIVEGVDLAQLAKGPGHFPATPLPGQAGNSAIAGHRVTHSAPFNRLDELVPGDQIEVETLQGHFTYEVLPGGGVNPDSSLGHRIITPYQTEILDQKPDQNLLTLMACHPKYDLKQRIVVVGRLVQNPAPTTPRSDPQDPGRADGDNTPLPDEAAIDAGAGLVGGDSSAGGPALLYGLAAIAVWLVAWIVARRWPGWSQWQRWVVFAAALPIFAVPLFLTFEAINDLLPAGY